MNEQNPFANSRSESFRRLNPQLFGDVGSDHPVSNPVAEPAPDKDRVLDVAEGEKGRASRFRVHVESRSKRLYDPDNGVCKALLDACRYSKILPQDTARVLELSMSQTQVKTEEEECVVIYVTPIYE